MRRISGNGAWTLILGFALTAEALAGDAKLAIQSHAPLRVAPPPAKRPLDKTPARFVDANQGDDRHEGTQARPWKSLAHAVTQLQAGETLCLRGGTYYENVKIRLLGRKGAPITLRSFPGEQAILDGGLPEFFEVPASAWQPLQTSPKSDIFEYVSARSYPNLRHVMGSFGDSMIGLVTYYHALDLRASRDERSRQEVFELDETTKDFKPIYCGPGLWYDAVTGRIHARLAHTHVPGFDNYRGVTDPRKLPLVIAPFRSVPLHVDGGQHLRFQDLIVRGAGYDAVVLDQASDIEFDNVTIWCGSYGFRATGVQRLKFYRSALYGNIPPWLARGESGLQSYPGRPQRDIARLNTHASFVAEAGREFSVYAFPFNDDWEISHSEFTEASDGPYLGGVSMKFHHNLVDNMQDDGLYLSPMYHRYERLMGKAKIEVYQNHLSRALTMLAFGGMEKTSDAIYFYRNVIDLRRPVNVSRPTSKEPGPVKPYAGHVMGDHGSPPWPTFFAYHNTVVSREPGRGADFLFTTGAAADRPRRSFNNIFIHGAGLTPLPARELAFAQSDANLYWQPGMAGKLADTFFTAYRASPFFTTSKKSYPPGFETHSLASDPKFIKADLGPLGINDYRLQPGSSALDAGVVLPTDWPDPLRSSDKGRPDLGALPAGVAPFVAGRAAAPAP